MDWSGLLIDVSSSIVNVVTIIATPLLAGIGIRYLNRRLKLDLTAQEMQQIKDAAAQAVAAIQQRMSESINAEKKAAALSAAIADLKARKISVPVGLLDNTIEAAVGAIKKTQQSRR